MKWQLNVKHVTIATSRVAVSDSWPVAKWSKVDFLCNCCVWLKSQNVDS